MQTATTLRTVTNELVAEIDGGLTDAQGVELATDASVRFVQPHADWRRDRAASGFAVGCAPTIVNLPHHLAMRLLGAKTARNDHGRNISELDN